ncbi:MAG TPA: hypothetical protein PL124_12435 [Candidatus Cloacimonadota bacterium]|nr:hypothetical protein [Candidatus Cloacimonadota bacterium]
MTEVTEIIPYTAWQQAVFVVLFIVIVIALLTWFSKQSEKWQAFIEASNEKWRIFNKEQREENNSCMSDVNNGLTNLTQVTQGLVSEVREMRTESREITAALALHDDQAKEIKHLIEVSGKPTPKPRAKKTFDSPPL